MLMQRAKPTPPSEDKRWKLVDVTMRRNGYSGHALIETLHSVQDCFGYLDDQAMKYVAQSLNLPLEQGLRRRDVLPPVHAEAEGQTHLRGLHGHGLLHQGGGRPGRPRARAVSASSRGETTADKELSVLGARCLGACGLAPAAVLDGTMLGNQSGDGLLAKIEEVICHEP